MSKQVFVGLHRLKLLHCYAYTANRDTYLFRQSGLLLLRSLSALAESKWRSVFQSAAMCNNNAAELRLSLCRLLNIAVVDTFSNRRLQLVT